jgi:hypothetical protein
MTSGSIERLEPLVVENEQLDAAERPQDAGIAPVAARRRRCRGSEDLGRRHREWRSRKENRGSIRPSYGTMPEKWGLVNPLDRLGSHGPTSQGTSAH